LLAWEAFMMLVCDRLTEGTTFDFFAMEFLCVCVPVRVRVWRVTFCISKAPGRVSGDCRARARNRQI